MVSIILFLIISEISVKKSSIQKELIEIEGYPDYPECLHPDDIENMIKEEELCRTTFGYKKMTDQNYENFINILAKHKKNPFFLNPEKRIMNAPSYDIIYMAEYHRAFNYLPMKHRKKNVDYSAMNETRRIIDFPYYFENFDLDTLFINSNSEFIYKDPYVSKLY